MDESDDPHPSSGLSAEHRYRLLAMNSSDIVYQTKGLIIEWISPSVTSQLGWQPEELIGGPAAALLAPYQESEWIEGNRERLLAGEDVYQQLLLSASDGSERWYAGTAHPLYEDDVVSGFVVGLHDIDDMYSARAELASAEDPYLSPTRTAGAAVYSVDRDGSIIEVNRAMCEFVGRLGSDLIGLPAESLLDARDVAAGIALRQQLLAGRIDSFRVTARFVGSDASVLHGDLSADTVFDDQGEVARIIMQVVDIPEQTRVRTELQALATTDRLTGLPNRSAILDQVETMLAETRGTPGRMGVLKIEVRNLAPVNESLGHDAGDRLLQIVGERLGAELPPHAELGRVSDLVFVVAVPSGADAQSVSGLAEQIAAAIATEIRMQGHRIVLSTSIGVAISHEESTTLSLLRDADVALSAAREQGAAVWRIFDPRMGLAADRRLLLTDALRDAVERNEFVVHYQPVVLLKDGNRVGYEALVRWQHPVDGLLEPTAFLPAAEDSGIIRDIGRIVLDRACRDIVENPDFHGEIGINVSAVELADPHWVRNFTRIVDDSGVDPRRLVIEVTETAVMSVRRDLAVELSELVASGVSLLLDDFGTGYSSMSLLQSMPVTGLKLDQSFVWSMDAPGSGTPLAQGLAGLVGALGINGVAEGVETVGQAERLAELGWEHGQGYYFGRPAPIAHWLA